MFLGTAVNGCISVVRGLHVKEAHSRLISVHCDIKEKFTKLNIQKTSSTKEVKLKSVIHLHCMTPLIPKLDKNES